MKSRYSIISAFLRERNTYNGICPVKRREGVKIIARKKRVWFPGATYHLMERGIRRQAIYEEEGDYQVFMVIVKQCLEKYGCVLHAYCMMTNHFHMLLETSDTDVSKFMKQIVYTVVSGTIKF